MDGLWGGWTRIVVPAVLEVAALSTEGAGRRRRSSWTVLAEVLDTVQWDDPVAMAARMDRLRVEVPATLEPLVDDAARRLDQFQRDWARLGRRCGECVLAAVRWALEQALYPPPDITRDEWFAARWRALETTDPPTANLFELVAEDRRRRSRHRQRGVRLRRH